MFSELYTALVDSFRLFPETITLTAMVVFALANIISGKLAFILHGFSQESTPFFDHFWRKLYEVALSNFVCFLKFWMENKITGIVVLFLLVAGGGTLLLVTFILLRFFSVVLRSIFSKQT
jgi:hypothetical protein